MHSAAPGPVDEVHHHQRVVHHHARQSHGGVEEVETHRVAEHPDAEDDAREAQGDGGQHDEWLSVASEERREDHVDQQEDHRKGGDGTGNGLVGFLVLSAVSDVHLGKAGLNVREARLEIPVDRGAGGEVLVDVCKDGHRALPLEAAVGEIAAGHLQVRHVREAYQLAVGRVHLDLQEIENPVPLTRLQEHADVVVLHRRG